MAYPHLSLSKTVPANPLAEGDTIKEWSPVVTTKYLVFEIHYNGVFMRMPSVKYVQGKIMSLQVSKTNRMSFHNLLDILSSQLCQDIRYLYFSASNVSLEVGLTIVESDYDMAKLYATAESQGVIDLYVCHVLENLSDNFFDNLTFDCNDEELSTNLIKHQGDLIAWEASQLITPPLRTPPSPLRMKGKQLEGKNLVKNLLHPDYIHDDFYFSYEDYMPGVIGFDLPALDVGCSCSSPADWMNTVFIDDGYKMPSARNVCFAKEVVLEGCGSAVIEQAGSSGQHKKWRHLAKKRKTRNFYFGSRTSSLRRPKMVCYFKMLYGHRVVGGLRKMRNWFLIDGRLHSRVVVKYVKPRFTV